MGPSRLLLLLCFCHLYPSTHSGGGPLSITFDSSISASKFLAGTQATVECSYDANWHGTEFNLTCPGSNSNITTDIHDLRYQVSLTFVVMPDYNGSSCECSVYISNLDQTRTHNTQEIVVTYGPTSVTAENTVFKPSCPGNTPDWIVSCHVDADDVDPHPNVTLYVNGTAVDATSIDIDDPSEIVYNFLLTNRSPGLYQARCLAVNPLLADVNVDYSFPVHVYETPPDPPQISVNNGTSIFPVTNGQKLNVKAAVNLTIQYVVDGGFPNHKNLTVACGGASHTVTGTSVSVSLQINESPDEVTCTCSVQHATGCYDQTSSFTIQANYGPSQLTTGPDGFDHFRMCPGEDPDFHMYCDVEKNVHPQPVALVEGLTSNDLSPWNVITNLQDVIRYQFTFTPDQSATTQAKCVAYNPTFPDLRTESSFELVISDPPPDAPKITVDSESASSIMTEGQALTVSLNQSLHVSCEVNGGHPAVSNVTLTCGSTTNVTGGTEASIRILVDKNTHQTVCKCSASHLSNCYDKTTEFSLEVWYPAVFLGYNANNETEVLEVNVGDIVDISCEAEGIPKPDLVVTGVYSGRDLHGQMISTNHYSNKFQMTRPIGCNESDIYVCKSQNGVSTQRELKVLVTCPPVLHRTVHDDVLLFMAGDGLFKGKFRIFCRPPPTQYKLFKIFRNTRQSRQKRESTAILMDSTQYTVEYTQLNDHEGELELDALDTSPDKQSEYRLDVYSEAAMALQIPFVVNRTSADVTADVRKDKTAVFIVVLVIAGFSCIPFATALFCLWREVTEEKRRKDQKPRAVKGVPRTQVAMRDLTPRYR